MFFDSGFANTICVINNAYHIHLDSVVIYTNKFILTVLDRLVEFNCISHYVFERNDCIKRIRIYLKYIDGRPAIKHIKLIHTNSHQYSVRYRFLKRFGRYFSTELCLLNTSRGILTAQEALQLKCGGFFLVCISY